MLADLKRRKVLNSAAVYGGAAFAVIQAADFMVPALGLPDSVSRGIAILAIAGFPLTLILAWIFDVSASGMRRTDPPTDEQLQEIASQARLRRWPVGIAGVLGMILLFMGVRSLVREAPPMEEGPGPLPAPGVESIAVLPFLDLTEANEDGGADGGMEMEPRVALGRGVADEILGALGQVGTLRVTGRTSAFGLADSAPPRDSVLHYLKVEALLEGSLERSDGSVELALRLISAGREDSLWTGTFLLPEAGFLKALDEVARTVIEALGIEPEPSEDKPLVPPRTESFPAYLDYLSGRALMEEGSPEAVREAIERYQGAVLLDSAFASAWAALAAAYVHLAESGAAPVSEVLPYARAALDRATSPEGETAEGYAVSGYLEWAYYWDLPDAEADLARAIEMSPTDPTARIWYAQLLATRRRWEPAMAEVRRALDVDPRSPLAHFVHGLILTSARWEGGEAAFRRALELDPDLEGAAFALGSELAMQGRWADAAEAFARFSKLTGGDASVYNAYLAALSNPSRREGAVQALTHSKACGPMRAAALLAHLGETDAALAALERAVRDRSPDLPWVNALPQYEALRSDPRTQSILAWIRF